MKIVMKLIKKAIFTFSPDRNLPNETHEVIFDNECWGPLGSSWEQFRVADKVVTEDGIVIKDRFGRTPRPDLNEVEVLRKALQTIHEEITIYRERHLKLLPGEPVRMYDGPPEWSVLEDFEDLANIALFDADNCRRKE